MSTELLERTEFSIEPISYPIIADKIADLASEYMPLKVAGIDDREGLAKVHSARMEIKTLRVNVEKRRKELKASSLEYGRRVDSAAKVLIDLLEPIEAHLQAEEDIVVNEQKRIAREAEEKKQRELQARIDALLEYGVFRSPAVIGALSPEEYAKLLSESKDAFEAKQRAEAEAAAKRKEEEERLAAERKRLEEVERQQKAEAAKQQAERDHLAAEQKRLDDERLARERAAELERAKAEAAEKAKQEAERRHAEEIERVKREAEAKAAREKAEAEEQARREKEEAEARERAKAKAEAERPQREKLIAVADVLDTLKVPSGPGEQAVCAILRDAAEQIRAIASGPLT